MAKTLSPEQRVLLDAVTRAKSNRSSMRDLAEARIRAQVEKELEDAELGLAMAVRRAHDSGISLNRIGREGLGTMDYKTAKGWLERTQGAVDSLEETTSPLFTALPSGEVEIVFPSFETTAKVPDGYPEVLTGRVRRDAKAPNGWRVTHDPFGSELGWLTWEMTQVPRTVPTSLSAALDAWEASR